MNHNKETIELFLPFNLAKELSDLEIKIDNPRAWYCYNNEDNSIHSYIHQISDSLIEVSESPSIAIKHWSIGKELKLLDNPKFSIIPTYSIEDLLLLTPKILNYDNQECWLNIDPAQCTHMGKTWIEYQVGYMREDDDYLEFGMLVQHEDIKIALTKLLIRLKELCLLPGC